MKNASVRNWVPALIVALTAAGVLAADKPLTKQRLSETSLPLLSPDYSANDAAIDVSPGTKELYSKIVTSMRDVDPATAIAQLAEYFLGTPYAAYSLDKSETERLRIDFITFDCMLFVEQLLSISVSNDWKSFVENTTKLRYQNSDVNYCSRHHYFQDWAASAESHGWIKDITNQIPGHQTRHLKLTFMSKNPNLYAPLKTPKNFKCIQEKESKSKVIQNYIPNGTLQEATNYFRNGDIFAVATSLDKLDVTHMGIVVTDKQSVSAIHAVPSMGVIRSVPFSTYVKGVPDSVGVVILRPRSRKDFIQEQPKT